ncbi:MAG: acetyl-CoA carboxylase biotin carboxyl carrier protein [Alphaproteobacteria bacterium]|jgi:acetyl-CoA carboxylase biotin carboxyl carrier protein|nr:acetyl-CoA carboxylase biotin carboxyl carrier protein [Alphaproteobacteria bacterium]
MNENKSKPLRDRIAKAIKGESTPGVDPEIVRELAKLLEETGLSEIEIERGGVRVRVARGTAVAAAPAPALSPPPQPAPSEPEIVRPKGTVITSPMVGTVYLSSQPGAPPFVKIGDSVTDGTLCIIEAMKTMNPVPSPVAGRVAEIYVHDSQPVEFGEPLMLIE